jgi:hypothetical protein|tara:strand:- start:1437 stop:3410 length:1974 start_codon:yes stop_codon:yes gene_type:complete
MPRLIMKAAILAAGVSSASAWASMVASEGTMEGAAPGLAPGLAPAMAPGAGPGAAPAMAPGIAPAPGPPVDPFAEPEFIPVEYASDTLHGLTTFNPKQAIVDGNCMDYTWDANNVMSYGPVPCGRPKVLEPEPQLQVEQVPEYYHLSLEELLEPILEPHVAQVVNIFADAIMADAPVWMATIDFPADSEEEACPAALEMIGATETEGVACQVIDVRRRTLFSNTYVLELYADPTKTDKDTMHKFELAFKGMDINYQISEEDAATKLEQLPGLNADAIAAFEEQVRNGEPMPMTTPPNVVGAPLTGCYEIDSSPPDGYIHQESNLEFTVDRGEHEGVKFEVESERFTSLTCSASPTHHFQGSEYCKGTDNCDETCRMIMPPKCNTTEASFGVCAPTVAAICDNMDNSRSTCTLASQKVLGATVSYNHLDVQNSPCVSSIHKVTAETHEAYRVAYDEWVFSYNNASHACKIGTAIRDYNGMAFVQHHQNMDNIRKVSEMVCDDAGFFDEETPAAKRSLLASDKNSETCSNIKQLIDEIKADTDLQSQQIQCFASECMLSKSLEAYKFQALDTKFFEYNATLQSYKASVETFNNAVADKFLKKAAAEEAFEGTYKFPMAGSHLRASVFSITTYWAFPKSRHTVCPYKTDSFYFYSKRSTP